MESKPLDIMNDKSHLYPNLVLLILLLFSSLEIGDSARLEITLPVLLAYLIALSLKSFFDLIIFLGSFARQNSRFYFESMITCYRKLLSSLLSSFLLGIFGGALFEYAYSQYEMTLLYLIVFPAFQTSISVIQILLIYVFVSFKLKISSSNFHQIMCQCGQLNSPLDSSCKNCNEHISPLHETNNTTEVQSNGNYWNENRRAMATELLLSALISPFIWILIESLKETYQPIAFVAMIALPAFFHFALSKKDLSWLQNGPIRILVMCGPMYIYAFFEESEVIMHNLIFYAIFGFFGLYMSDFMRRKVGKRKKIQVHVG